MTIPYDYFYTIVKEKTPKILEEAGVDPFSNCPYTLSNSHYKNIFIFGADIFPTIHSFSAVNYQAHIICKNLELNNSLFYLSSTTEKKRIEYNGYSEIPFWINTTSLIKLTHQYATQVEDDYGIIFNFGAQSNQNKLQKSINNSSAFSASKSNFK